ATSRGRLPSGTCRVEPSGRRRVSMRASPQDKVGSPLLRERQLFGHRRRRGCSRARGASKGALARAAGSEQSPALLFQGAGKELHRSLRGAAARQVALVGSAQGGELLVQPVVAAVPLVVVRVDAEKNMSGRPQRRDVQPGRVLPALLLAVI